MHLKPEILAPAGDMDMLRAAVYSGADCVYLGVQGFNARRGAKNFGPEELREAVQFCHARGCGVYAAVNTLVFPDKTGALDEAVQAVAAAGCDAVIVQDLAVALRVQQIAPHIPVHGSTQMSVHSLAGVQKLAALGFSRAILARELSAEETAHIAAHSPIELEVFVHGALCVCVSGQCTMSAFLGGRSANRGGCAGPCRLPFRAEGGTGAPPAGNTPAGQQHHLSLKDLSILDALPQLAKMGIASAKIEGRLRGPEYCAVVVTAARAAREGKPYDKQLLQQVFSRSGFTDGWYTGSIKADMLGTRTPQDTAALKKALPAARALYRREAARVPVDMWLAATHEGAALTVSDGTHAAHKDIPGPLPPAQNEAADTVEKALRKTGGTPFYLRHAVVDTAGRHIAAGQVNAARREALESLLRQREQSANAPLWPETGPRPLPALLAKAQVQANTTTPKPPQKSTTGAAKRLRARFNNVAALPPNAADLCDELVLPLSLAGDVPHTLRHKTWLWLPRTAFGRREEELRGQVQAAAQQGFAGFEVQNIAHLALCEGLGLPLVAGAGLNITNAYTLALLHAMGCTGAVLSPELSATQMAQLLGQAQALGTPLPNTAAIAYGHVPLMVTRAAPLAACGGGNTGHLVDRRGRAFAVDMAEGTSTLYNPVPLWMADKLGALPVGTALLLFTHEGAGDAADVLERFARGLAAKGEFTRGLYEKGTQE